METKFKLKQEVVINAQFPNWLDKGVVVWLKYKLKKVLYEIETSNGESHFCYEWDIVTDIDEYIRVCKINLEKMYKRDLKDLDDMADKFKIFI